MFAVISTGGKQYCVSEGQRVRVERLSAEVGDELSFDAMLIGGQEGSDTRIGTSGKPVGQVRATVCEHGRAKKIEVIKFQAAQGLSPHAGASPAIHDRGDCRHRFAEGAREEGFGEEGSGQEGSRKESPG